MPAIIEHVYRQTSFSTGYELAAAEHARSAAVSHRAKQLDVLLLFDTRESTTDCNRNDSPSCGLALRFLHVVPTYLPAVRYGGPIRSVHALCRALAADGHDVHVFTTNVDGPGRQRRAVGAAGRSRGRQGHLLSQPRSCGASIGRRRWARARRIGRRLRRRASACRLSLADLGRRARRARRGRAVRHLAARHARARVDPAQEPVGEGRVDHAGRAR